MTLFKYAYRIDRATDGIRNSPKISPQNKEILAEYFKHLQLSDYSHARIYKILVHLKKTAENIDFDFKNGTREDIENFVMWLKGRKDIGDTTRVDYKTVMKTFYKWINGGDRYPECVEWMKVSHRNTKKKLPEAMYTEEDVKKLIECATSLRDKAFIAILWETGARVGEIDNMKVGDLEEHKYGLKIIVNGKTGPRRLPLISSVPHINQWLNAHPDGRKPMAPLWVNVGTKGTGKKTGYRSLTNAISRAMERAGLNKPVNPHHFRHSRATYLANKFTEAQLCEWFGWVQGSDIPARYVHLSGREIDAEYGRIHGITDKEEPTISRLTPTNCPRCDKSIPPDAQFCYMCGMALTVEAVRDIEEKERELAVDFSSAAKEDPKLLDDMQKFAGMLRLIEENPDLLDTVKKLMNK